MTTELKIDGMSCGHCVSSVKQALEAVPGVTEVSVSLEEGRATVDADGPTLEQLVAAVEEEGFRIRKD